MSTPSRVVLFNFGSLLRHGKQRGIRQPMQIANYMSGSGRRKALPVNTDKGSVILKVGHCLSIEVIKFVPQQEAWIIERFGKYDKTLSPGLNFLIPFIDEIKYVQSLKEIAIEIPQQSAITRDNVTLHLDGVLYFRVVDPYKASYGVEDPQFAITQLAQTTMRSELGKISLDEVFKERDALNHNIVEAINSAANVWGIKCLRYEIRDIQLPAKVRESMQMQVEAERRKRAAVLESEGQRESAINRASGEANAILVKAKARAEAIDMISKALHQRAGGQAAALSVAEQYVQAFANLAKSTNTVILPSNAGDVAGMVTQAMAVYGKLVKSTAQARESNSEPEDPEPDPYGGGKVLPEEIPSKDRTAGERHPPSGSSLDKSAALGGMSLLGSEHFSVLTSPTRRRNFDSSDFASP